MLILQPSIIMWWYPNLTMFFALIMLHPLPIHKRVCVCVCKFIGSMQKKLYINHLTLIIIIITSFLTTNYYIYFMHFTYYNEQAKCEVGGFKVAFIGHGYQCIEFPPTYNLEYPKA